MIISSIVTLVFVYTTRLAQHNVSPCRRVCVLSRQLPVHRIEIWVLLLQGKIDHQCGCFWFPISHDYRTETCTRRALAACMQVFTYNPRIH
ncbi:hypothetical protein EDD37DRAFT_267190 [Exophiala viscosa]|uniref:uncharacterized protein n=1 Tax=Exophiala viscosa TaxID=2486360 RepID=UPI002197516F|nr:hypothetical protein EDD37DRAFT_267190 [Exophiala viscosa]